VTEDTVFRIGSITKTFTAIAVMQLCEQGRLELDAPADAYLRSFRLVPAGRAGPPTVRQLLTHSGGIGYWRRLSDLVQPALGAGDRAGRRGAVPLAEYYRHGLPVEVEPGTKWAYSNHGFATLGQIVEDVSGEPLDRRLREQVFVPLGMEHTDLVRPPSVATGYVLRRRGLRPVADRDIPVPGAGGAYSSSRDLVRYAAALAGGSLPGLAPATLASMLEPHFLLDPRAPGWGLGFELGAEDGHRTFGHTGIVPGFLSALVVAPDDGLAVIALSNTGGLDARGAPELVASAVLRRELGLPVQAIRDGVPPRPDVWEELCGWYAPDPGPVTNLFVRAILGAGAEVVVRRGHLLLAPLTPVPGLRRAMRLYPDDENDPYVFRLDLSDRGRGPVPVVFSRDPHGTLRLLMLTTSLTERPEVRNPRRWAEGALIAGATALAVRARRRAAVQSGG
jgi:CubicO group peptidase (beta-lactamase class C family)